MLKPYRVYLYAANGKTVKTFGMAERVRFQQGGYWSATNFVVVDHAMGVEAFFLGRSFLRAYQVLVDLTAMKIVVRVPVNPVWHHTRTQIGDPDLVVKIALNYNLLRERLSVLLSLTT